MARFLQIWNRASRGGGAALLAALLPVLLALAAGRAPAAEAELLLLHTSDLHASIGPGARDEGDWLRLAALIRRERQRAGPGQTLLLDCGDTCQGSFLAAQSRGAASIALLNHLRYDVWVPGNHDLDFGARRLGELMDACQGPAVLNGNLRLPGRPPPAAWKLFERGGLRVAVLGLNYEGLPDLLWGRDWEGCRSEPWRDTLARVLPEVQRARPDLTVLAVHGGWVWDRDPEQPNPIRDVTRQFPSVQVILGAHTHREIPGWKLQDTWYVQAGSHARRLGRVSVRYDRESRRLLSIESQLLAPGELEPDPAAARAVAPWLDTAREAAGQRLVQLQAGVADSGRPGVACGSSELFCRALAERTGASAAFHGNRPLRNWTPGRWLNAADLFAAMPFENGIGVARLTPAEIAAIVAEQWAQRDDYAYNGLYGLRAELDAQGQVQRLTLPDGRVPAPGERLPVAFTSFTLAGGGGRYPVLTRLVRQPEARLEELDLNLRQVLADYLRQHPAPPPPERWLSVPEKGRTENTENTERE